MIQSFAPGEVTPEQAMQIGEELCDRYLKGDYQYVIAVHHDKSHLHCHIIFNKPEPKPTQTVIAPTKPKQSAEPNTIDIPINS